MFTTFAHIFPKTTTIIGILGSIEMYNKCINPGDRKLHRECYIAENRARKAYDNWLWGSEVSYPGDE